LFDHGEEFHVEIQSNMQPLNIINAVTATPSRSSLYTPQLQIKSPFASSVITTSVSNSDVTKSKRSREEIIEEASRKGAKGG
jgi:hypothetical protein